MKPTQEQVIAWAREAGAYCHYGDFNMGHSYELQPDQLERFAALAYEAGQESMKWDGIHSCHPDCQRPACVHTRKTYQEGYEAGRKDENEACIRACDSVDLVGADDCIDAIRARREQ